MRALRPTALPSDTSVRFVLVLAAVTTASLYLFQALWFAGRSTGFVGVVRGCLGDPTAGTPVTLGGFDAELAATEACRAGISREQGVVALAGATLVLVAAWGLYRAMPAWRERRRHLVQPDPLDAEALIDSVDRLAEQARVRPTPAIRLDVGDQAVSGVAYGAGSRMCLGLSGGLVVSQVTEPETYEAVVRHELGHVANRDVRWTYYSVATGWAFLGLALLPVVLTFLVRDPQYVLRLGWRTAVLAALVATTLAALLRTREQYADARAAEWGSADALDRVLARAAVVSRPDAGSAHQPVVSGEGAAGADRGAGPATGTGSRSGPTPGRPIPAPSRRRPAWRRPSALRLHPDPQARRDLLADPDGLFTASGWVAFASALACGTAASSIGDIAYLLVSTASVAVSTLAVAPLLAIALCVPAWRVALRGVVRGAEPSIVLPLGLGAGVGLALAPLLTMAAALGGIVTSAQGWLGYTIWSVAMVALGLAVAWWVCGTARLAVTATLGPARGPGRALMVHVAITSVLVALWLAGGAQARTLVTGIDVADLRAVAPWDLLPGLAFGVRLPYFPLAVAGLLLALPLWALVRIRGLDSVADWPWRDGGPTRPGDLAQVPDARRTRPTAVSILVVGAGAGTVAGLVSLGMLLAGESLREEVRTSDAFALVLGSAIEWAILVAGVVAGAVAVGVLPRLWWPLGLASSLVAMAIAAAGGWVLLTANRYGFLQHTDGPAGPVGLDATLLLLVRPAARAALPCVLVVALAGVLRGWRSAAVAARASGRSEHPFAGRDAPAAGTSGSPNASWPGEPLALPAAALASTPALRQEPAARTDLAGATAATRGPAARAAMSASDSAPAPPGSAPGSAPAAVASVPDGDEHRGELVGVRGSGEETAPAAPAPAPPASASVPAPSRSRWWVRGVVGGLVAALACAVLIAPRIAGVLALQPRQVQTAAATVEVPAAWSGAVDPGTGLVVLDSLDGEVRILIAAIAEPAPPAIAATVVVGGVAMPLVAELDQGVEHVWVYEAPTPAGPHRVAVVARPQSVATHVDEIRDALAGVGWTPVGG